MFDMLKGIKRRIIGDHRKYQHPGEMNIVIESEMGRMKDLPSKEWNHSILDRKCKDLNSEIRKGTQLN